MARKRKKPTSAKRSQRQNTASRYRRAREDAQLVGLLPTKPEDALKPERVDPALQDEQRFPGLDRLAIRNDGQGWAVNEHVKRKVVEKAAEVLFQRRTYFKDGLEIELPPDRTAEAQASRTLLAADEKQYEREQPEAAGKAKGGGTTEVNVAIADPYQLYLKAIAEVREGVDGPSRGIDGTGTPLLAGDSVLPKATGDDSLGAADQGNGGSGGEPAR